MYGSSSSLIRIFNICNAPAFWCHFTLVHVKALHLNSKVTAEKRVSKNIWWLQHVKKSLYPPQCLGVIPAACSAIACSLVWGNPSITQPFLIQSNSFILSWTIFTHRSVGRVCKFKTYCKIPKFLDTRIFAVIYLKLKKRDKPLGMLWKLCKWNGKQWRPWSDCSSKNLGSLQ